LKKVALHTLGCKLNFSETSTIGNQFLDKGFEIIDFWKSVDSPKEKADIYFFNTCTVTENAEKEFRQLVRRALRQNPDAFVIAAGCYAQLRPEEISQISGVDAVIGSKEKFKLFSILNNFKKKNLACIYVSPTEDLNEFGPARSTDPNIIERTRAFLKIQDGCDYKCSFCTIPLARGLSRSMKPEDAVDDLKKLIDKGYKEIILTGVNVGDYGKAYDINLYQLLLRLVEVPGNFRIRISSIEPNLLTEEIIDLTASHEKMCKHFHIPLQSGSSKILRLMQRRYKASYYQNLIYRVKEKINNAGIGVDVIVGFPGETEEDFLQTYYFLQDLPISYLHVFTYSERRDIKGINLDGTVDVFERRKRNNMLRMLSERKKNIFYRQMIGDELEVLFENENHDGQMKGFSSNYIRVSNEFNSNLVNEFCTVKISSACDGLCEGNISRLGSPIFALPTKQDKLKDRQLALKNEIDMKAC